MPTTAPSPAPETEATSRSDSQATFETYSRDNIKIVDKDRRLVPLVLNHTQKVILRAIADCRRRGVPPRLIILKSRQVGCSTLSIARIFWAAVTRMNRSGLVIAHNDKSTRALFRMVRVMLGNHPAPPSTKLDNVREVHFEHNDSRIQVETAGMVRGYTASEVLCSEFAFWEDAVEAFVALMQGVPRSVDSLVVVESTANGVGNKFHALWTNAMRDQADPDIPDDERGWVPIFVPWFVHEEYQKPARFGAEQLTPEERTLFTLYPEHMTLEKVAWRRWCVRTNLDGDEEKFRVEYPCTPDEAFQGSGRPVYDREGLRYYQSCVPPAVPVSSLPETEEIEWDKEKEKPIRVPAHRGRLRVYRPPKARHSYVLGVDPSEGDPGSDYTPIVVLCQQTLNVDAVWHGKAPPDLLAQYAVWLAKLFNDGLIVNEANNHGILFHTTVLDVLQYPNLYFREVSPESVAEQVTQKPGVFMSARQKMVLVDTARKFVREKAQLYRNEPTRLISDPTLIGEFSTYVYRRKENELQTKAQAESGHFDDCNTAFMVALWAHRGNANAPLEPIPETEFRASLERYRQLRERDEVGAQRHALDIMGMTGEEIEQALEDEHQRDLALQRSGMGRMT